MALARRAASQSLGLRSVHLRIQPRPSNLSESREIYRLLQRFGEISTYKYLRYEYHNPADNIALAIYRDADAAQAALNASPLRFSLEKIAADVSPSSSSSAPEDADEATPNARPAPDDIEDILRPGHLLNSNPLSTPHSSSSPSTTPTKPPAPAPAPLPFTPPKIHKTSQKYFQITLDRSRVVHQDFVERQPYWKQFEPMKSLAQEELRKVVPLLGLSDVSKRPPNAHRTPNKVLRAMSEYVEKGMFGLREMFEEGGSGAGGDGMREDGGRGQRLGERGDRDRGGRMGR